MILLRDGRWFNFTHCGQLICGRHLILAPTHVCSYAQSNSRCYISEDRRFYRSLGKIEEYRKRRSIVLTWYYRYATRVVRLA
ncbi:hypothetical protein J6590_041361 [Homalodisca vitripennis]|nr:hypothetical protein J6590_041361 [Homalodisca vitripennis]